MATIEHLQQRAAQLQAEQVYWEGVKRSVNAALTQIVPDQGQYTDNQQETLKSLAASAAFHLQQIAQELDRIRQQRESEAREAAQRDEAARNETLSAKDTERQERELREEITRQEPAREERATAERIEAEARQQEEARRQELLQQDARREEAQREDAQRAQAELERAQQDKVQSDLDFLGQEIAAINEEYQYVLDQIDEEWGYVDSQIHEEMEYNVEQTLGVVAEVAREAALAIANPVSERESTQFAEQMKQQLVDFVSTESFQTAPAENKEMWLAEKFKEQQQALHDEFGERRDDFGNRKAMEERLAELQRSAMEVVKVEQAIQKKLNEELEELKKVTEQTKERLDKNIADEALREEKKKQADELAATLEAQQRAQADKECQAQYDKWRQEQLQREEERRLEEQRQLEEQRRREALRASLSLGFD